jgi:predicted AAA+ superfamily ATPase
MSDLDRLIKRAEQVLERLEAALPPKLPAPDWKAALACRWRKRNGRGFLQPITHPHRIRLTDLQKIEEQIRLVEQNTRQFLEGLVHAAPGSLR